MCVSEVRESVFSRVLFCGQFLLMIVERGSGWELADGGLSVDQQRPLALGSRWVN